MTKTIKRIAILLTLVMLTVSVQLPMVMAETPDVGIMKYYVDGTQVLELPSLTAGQVVKSQIKAEAGDILVSAVYNGTVMQIADVGEVIPSQDGKVYETEITIPAGYDEATWDYKNFIWKDAAGTMTPAIEKTEAFVLSVAGEYVNAVVVKWDAVDGYMGEEIEVLRDGVLVATVPAAQGSYVDKFIADGNAHTYEVTNKAKTRVSNQVSATPITAASVLEKGAWIKAGLADDGVTAADEGLDMKITSRITDGVDANKQYNWIDGTVTDAADVVYTGYGFTDNGTDSSYLRLNGTVKNPAKIPVKGKVEVEDITAADGISDVWYIDSYCRIRTNWQSSNSNLNFTITNTNNKFGTAENPVNNISVFVEYWGTRTADMMLRYANTYDTNNYAEVRCALNKSSANEWRIAQYDLKDAELYKSGYGSNSGSWAGIGEQIGINSEGYDTFVRRVLVLPTTEVDKILAFDDIFAESESELVAHNRDEAVIDYSYDGVTGKYSNGAKNAAEYLFSDSGSATGGDGSFFLGTDEDGVYRQFAPVTIERTDKLPSYKARYNVDDAYLFGAMPVQFEIEYKTNASKNLRLYYRKNASDESDSSAYINLNPDGKKHTVIVDIDDAYLGNTVHATEKRDFVIQGGTGLVYNSDTYLYIYSIKVRKSGDRLMGDLSL